MWKTSYFQLALSPKPYNIDHKHWLWLHVIVPTTCVPSFREIWSELLFFMLNIYGMTHDPRIHQQHTSSIYSLSVDGSHSLPGIRHDLNFSRLQINDSGSEISFPGCSLGMRLTLKLPVFSLQRKISSSTVYCTCFCFPKAATCDGWVSMRNVM